MMITHCKKIIHNFLLVLTNFNMLHGKFKLYAANIEYQKEHNEVYQLITNNNIK